MKIVLYGTCSSPYFFRELISMAKEQGIEADWRAIILSWRHYDVYKNILPIDHLFYVHPRINELMKQDSPDLQDLSMFDSYPGSIFRDITADKNVPGHLRRYPKEYQLRNAASFYRAYKEYLLKEKPDVVFFPPVETYEGMILYKTAVELGIKTVFHSHSRNVGLAFFSKTPNEDLPDWVAHASIPTEFIEKAEKYIDDYQKSPTPAFLPGYDPVEDEVVSYGRPVPFHKKLWKIPKFIYGLIKDSYLEPHAARPNPFYSQLLLQLWGVNDLLWKIKAKLNRHFFDIWDNRSFNKLPKRFVYFPLHCRPEQTITTYAPYFEDQLRAIDLALINMPSNCYLVVKEHPFMKGRPSTKMYRELQRRAGVILAAHDVQGLELIKRSILILTINGSTGMEALLFGKPAVVLAENLFSSHAFPLESFPGFNETIKKAIDQPSKEIREKLVDLLARVFMVGGNYILIDPHDVSNDWKFMMNRTNINRFLKAFMAHVETISKQPIIG